MSGNGSDVTEHVAALKAEEQADVPAKNEGATPLIERRIAVLQQQLQRNEQEQGRLATEHAACQGALLHLMALRDEILAETEEGS